MNERHREIEAAVSAALDAGDNDRALTLAMRGYGAEILGFIEARLRDPVEAREAFAWFAEDLWRSLPGFGRHSSVRTWSYAIARNATTRFIERELRPRARGVPLSQISRLSVLLVSEITRDSRPALDERVARLRAQLSEQEQTLLTLRVDRGMSWKEVAQVLVFAGAEADEQALAREALRLRQQFHVLKEKLRTLAKA